MGRIWSQERVARTVCALCVMTSCISSPHIPPHTPPHIHSACTSSPPEPALFFTWQAGREQQTRAWRTWSEEGGVARTCVYMVTCVVCVCVMMSCIPPPPPPHTPHFLLSQRKRATGGNAMVLRLSGRVCDAQLGSWAGIKG